MLKPKSYPSHVLFLAAGFGTRLGEFGQTSPKGLIEVDDNTLVGRIIDDTLAAYQQQGFPPPSFALVTNAKFFTQYKQWLTEHYAELDIKILNNGVMTAPERKGAIGDLIWALDQLQWQDQDLVVLSSDNYHNVNTVARLLQFFVAKDQQFVTLARQVHDKSEIANRLGCYVLADDNKNNGRVEQFVEKPAQPSSQYAAASFYIYPAAVSSLLKQYAEQGHDLDSPGAITPWLLKQAVSVYALVLEPGVTVVDVGTEPDRQRVQNHEI